MENIKKKKKSVCKCNQEPESNFLPILVMAYFGVSRLTDLPWGHR